MSVPVEVSVICLTFNHGDLLRQSVDSMIAQQTEFSFEIVVHDDCSTDGTTGILREYAEKYPGLIVPIYEAENQYNSGRRLVSDIVRNTAQGKYIAICEGDDYWTYPYKLQDQYNALEENPQIDLCTGRGIIVDAVTQKRVGWMRPKECDCIIPVQEVIDGGGQYFASSSLFFRRHVLADITYEFEEEMDFDYVWQIKGAINGGVYYLDREMSAYRSGVEGAWTTRMKTDVSMRKKHFQRMIHMLKTLDAETSFRYHDVISRRIKMAQRAEESFLDQLEAHNKEIIELLGDNNKIYLWGNGKRGMALQQFCQKYNIYLKGVCDAVEESVGEVTSLGIAIVSTEVVKHSAGIILASNNSIYDALKKMGLQAKIINLQQYTEYE